MLCLILTGGFLIRIILFYEPGKLLLSGFRCVALLCILFAIGQVARVSRLAVRRTTPK